MSSQDLDVDISVVSSPEPSPRPDDNSSRHEFTFAHSTPQHQSSYNNNNNNIESRLSPPKISPEQGKTSGGSAYTSFSITSILSRNEPKKNPITPMPTIPLHTDATGTVHDAAMLSR